MRFLIGSIVAFGFLQISSVMAQSESRSVEVAVEVDEVPGNEAETIENATQEAFKAAVTKVFAGRLRQEELEKRQKEAASLIKSFRLLSRRTVGGRVFAEFQCEVLLPQAQKAAPRAMAGFRDHFAFEISWQVGGSENHLAKVVDFLAEQPETQIGLVKMAVGSHWIEVFSMASAESLLSKLRPELASGVRVQVLRDFDKNLYGLE